MVRRATARQWCTAQVGVANPRKRIGRGNLLSSLKFVGFENEVVELRAERGVVNIYLDGRLHLKGALLFTVCRESKSYEACGAGHEQMVGFFQNGDDLDPLERRIRAMFLECSGGGGGALRRRSWRGSLGGSRGAASVLQRRATVSGATLGTGDAADDQLPGNAYASEQAAEDLTEEELQQMMGVRKECNDIFGERRKEQLLPRLSMFAECSQAFLEVLCGRIKKVPVRSGSYVAMWEHPSEQRMYVVAAGCLNLTRGVHLLREVRQGDTFGEANLVGWQTRWHCNAHAVGATMLYEVTISDLKAAVAKSSEDAARLPWASDDAAAAPDYKTGDELAAEWKALRSCAVLKRCSESFLRDLALATEARLYFPGEVLVTEGDASSELLILESGQVQIELAGVPVRTEGIPGERVRLAYTDTAPRCQRDSATRCRRPSAQDKAPAGFMSPKARTTSLERLQAVSAVEPAGIAFGEMRLLGVSSRASTTIRVTRPSSVRVLSNDVFVKVLAQQTWDLSEMQHFFDLRQADIYPPLEVRQLGLSGGSHAFWSFLQAHVEERVFCVGDKLSLDHDHKTLHHKPVRDLSFCRLNRGRVLLTSEMGMRSAMARNPDDELGEGSLIMGDMFLSGKTVEALEICHVSILHRGVVARALEELPADRVELLPVLTQAGMMDISEGGMTSILAEKSIFAGASEEFINDVVEDARVRVFTPGQSVIRQGDEGASMFILWTGSANIVTEIEDVSERGRRTRTLTHVGTLTNGAVFGELAMLGLSKRNASIVAVSVCCMWEISHAKVYEILDRHPVERESFKTMITNYLAKLPGQSVGELPVFAGFSAAFRRFIAQNSERRLYFGGERIVSEGTFGDRLLYLDMGVARVEVLGHRLPSMQSGGSHFGFAMICRRDARDTYPFSVTAESMCQVFVVTRSTYQSALVKHPDMREVSLVLQAREEQRVRLQREQAKSVVQTQVHRHSFLRSIMRVCEDVFDWGSESEARRQILRLYVESWRQEAAKSRETRRQAMSSLASSQQSIDRWLSRRREQMEQVRQREATRDSVPLSASERGSQGQGAPKKVTPSLLQSTCGSDMSRQWSQVRETDPSPYLSPFPHWKRSPTAPQRVLVQKLPPLSAIPLTARPYTAPVLDTPGVASAPVGPALSTGAGGYAGGWWFAADSKLSVGIPGRPPGSRAGSNSIAHRCRGSGASTARERLSHMAT